MYNRHDIRRITQQQTRYQTKEEVQLIYDCCLGLGEHVSLHLMYAIGFCYKISKENQKDVIRNY